MFAKLSATFITIVQAILEKFATGLISMATKSLSLKISNLEEENRALSQRFDTLKTSARLNNHITTEFLLQLLQHGQERVTTCQGTSTSTKTIWGSKLLHLTSTLPIPYLVKKILVNVQS